MYYAGNVRREGGRSASHAGHVRIVGKQEIIVIFLSHDIKWSFEYFIVIILSEPWQMKYFLQEHHSLLVLDKPPSLPCLVVTQCQVSKKYSL